MLQAVSLALPALPRLETALPGRRVIAVIGVCRGEGQASLRFGNDVG